MIDTGIKQKNSFVKPLLEIIITIGMLALLYFWFGTNNKIIAKVTGLIGLAMSGLTYFKPELFNSFRSNLLYPEKVADQFCRNLQKVNSILGIMIYILIFINYRITTTREFGILGIALSMYMIIIIILWWKNIAQFTQSPAKYLIAFSLLFCILLIPFSVKWILRPEPWGTHFEASWPGFIGTAIGFLIALLLIKFGQKKLW